VIPSHRLLVQVDAPLGQRLAGLIEARSSNRLPSDLALQGRCGLLRDPERLQDGVGACARAPPPPPPAPLAASSAQILRHVGRFDPKTRSAKEAHAGGSPSPQTGGPGRHQAAAADGTIDLRGVVVEERQHAGDHMTAGELEEAQNGLLHT
jgi:hypothetical protein